MTLRTLRICGTPIGNLGDVTQRPRDTLAGATAICCDLFLFPLLSALGIPAPKLARRPLDANTEERGAIRLVERLLHGDDVALVTDAGMPAVSDPGSWPPLAAAAAGVVVEAISWPSAVTEPSRSPASWAMAVHRLRATHRRRAQRPPRRGRCLGAPADRVRGARPTAARPSPPSPPASLSDASSSAASSRSSTSRRPAARSPSWPRSSASRPRRGHARPPSAGAPRPAGGPSEGPDCTTHGWCADPRFGARRALRRSLRPLGAPPTRAERAPD